MLRIGVCIRHISVPLNKSLIFAKNIPDSTQSLKIEYGLA